MNDCIWLALEYSNSCTDPCPDSFRQVDAVRFIRKFMAATIDSAHKGNPIWTVVYAFMAG